jgi:pyruvate carboxylase subunit B
MQELIQVRQEMGYPPMAAPINRIAAQQALSNTLSEKRYQHIDQPFRDYVKGLYGASPAPIDAEVRKRALGGSEAITLRPADLLQPGMDRARKEMRKLGLSPSGSDQILTYILFPEEAPGILRPALRPVEASAISSPPPPASEPSTTTTAVAAPVVEPIVTSATTVAREFTVEVDGEPYKVRILGDGSMPAAPPPTATQGAAPKAGTNGAIQAPMQGMVVKVKVSRGDRVRLGDVVVILEAMKMQNDIVATVAGTVREVFAREGAIVAPNEVLMTIG